MDCVVNLIEGLQEGGQQARGENVVSVPVKQTLDEPLRAPILPGLQIANQRLQQRLGIALGKSLLCVGERRPSGQVSRIAHVHQVGHDGGKVSLDQRGRIRVNSDTCHAAVVYADRVPAVRGGKGVVPEGRVAVRQRDLPAEVRPDANAAPVGEHADKLNKAVADDGVGHAVRVDCREAVHHDRAQRR